MAKAELLEISPYQNMENSVCVPKREYEALVRDSEQMAVLRRLLAGNEYTSITQVMTMIGVKRVERKENNNEPV